MFCSVCGKQVFTWINRGIIDDDLANSWKLTADLRKKLDLRESQFCPHCHCSTRNRALAQTIMEFFPFKGIRSLNEWVGQAGVRDLQVAEINSCGKIHQFLKRLPNLKYSEYLTKESGNLKLNYLNPVHEDIMNLSYPDNLFDLVVHCEVLEHVSNPLLAIKECGRVLKPGGVCLFTIPVLFERKTIQRIKLDLISKKMIFLKPPSYHGSRLMVFLRLLPFASVRKEDYLVWWEFGGDFIKQTKLKMAYFEPATQTFVFSRKKI